MSLARNIEEYLEQMTQPIQLDYLDRQLQELNAQVLPLQIKLQLPVDQQLLTEITNTLVKSGTIPSKADLEKIISYTSDILESSNGASVVQGELRTNVEALNKQAKEVKLCFDDLVNIDLSVNRNISLTHPEISTDVSSLNIDIKGMEKTIASIETDAASMSSELKDVLQKELSPLREQLDLARKRLVTITQVNDLIADYKAGEKTLVKVTQEMAKLQKSVSNPQLDAFFKSAEAKIEKFPILKKATEDLNNVITEYIGDDPIKRDVISRFKSGLIYKGKMKEFESYQVEFENGLITQKEFSSEVEKFTAELLTVCEDAFVKYQKNQERLAADLQTFAETLTLDAVREWKDQHVNEVNKVLQVLALEDEKPSLSGFQFNLLTSRIPDAQKDNMNFRQEVVSYFLMLARAMERSGLLNLTEEQIDGLYEQAYKKGIVARGPSSVLNSVFKGVLEIAKTIKVAEQPQPVASARQTSRVGSTLAAPKAKSVRGFGV